MAYKTRRKQSKVRTQEAPEVISRRKVSVGRFTDILRHVREQELLYYKRMGNPLWRAFYSVAGFFYELKTAIRDSLRK